MLMLLILLFLLFFAADINLVYAFIVTVARCYDAVVYVIVYAVMYCRLK